jgi:hypothetical protein
MSSATQSSPLDNTVFIDLAIESWRFAKRASRWIRSMPAHEQPKIVSQLLYFNSRIEAALQQSGLNFVELEGTTYDTGIPAEVVNLGDFSSADTLVVDQVLEPAVVGANGFLRLGKVIVKRT